MNEENDDNEFEMAINEDGKLHPINAVAQYCFGMICAECLQEVADEEPNWDYELMIKDFNLAISFGLTHEISTSHDPESARLREEIWGKVTESKKNFWD